jgi:hypothetical protein
MAVERRARQSVRSAEGGPWHFEFERFHDWAKRTRVQDAFPDRVKKSAMPQAGGRPPLQLQTAGSGVR